MIGTKLAHYEVTSHLGTGGMGEVYQASDLRLGRSVAIKLLPEAFTHDADRAARFEREARVLASLNHPRIAAIYGIEESGSRKFLVMELVSGETLADRIARGAVPADEALRIAGQIAEALEAAHEKGVIHRDLKPANIKLTPDGQVKVLDFGLAKALAAERADASPSNSPTLISAAASHGGMILGTAAYMSPEQARGMPVDARSDVFAFGCVLFEMLTGRRLFVGETASDIVAGVLKSDPDWNWLPSDTSPSVRRLLERCLRKDRRRRLQTAADIRNEIEDAASGVAENTQQTPPVVPGRRAWLPWGAALVFLAVAAVLAVLYCDIYIVNALRSTRFTFNESLDRYPVWSPDGHRIIFDSNRKGRRDFYWGLSDRSGSEELLWESDGDKAANDVSPDGRSFLYVSLSPETGADLWVLPLDEKGRAGEPRVFLKTMFEERQSQFSPDGQWVAYQSTESGVGYEIYVRPFSGAGGQYQISTGGGVQPRWSRDGKELYYVAPNGNLMAVSFDKSRSTLPGKPISLFRARLWGGGSNAVTNHQYAVTRDGRFLMNITADAGTTTPITVLLNWKPPAK